jgi:hypothetical protein
MGKNMVIELNNKIKVGVVFEEHMAIMPKWFMKKGRKYNIDKVNYLWDEKQGKKIIKNFAVLAEGCCYEISYDTEDLVWRLTSVDEES